MGGMRFRGGVRPNTFFVTLAALLMAAVFLWAPPAGAQTPPTEADLSITKRGPAQVEPGQNFNYVLRVTNAAGAATATDVIVEDELPKGVMFVESDPEICTVVDPDPDGDDRQNVTCIVPPLAAGQTQTITLTVTAPRVPGEIVNRASVSSQSDTGDDPDAVSDRVTTAVVPNLVINKLDDPDPVSREGLLEYTLRVQNRSEVPVNGVSITDDLPVDDVDFIRVVWCPTTSLVRRPLASSSAETATLRRARSAWLGSSSSRRGPGL